MLAEPIQLESREFPKAGEDDRVNASTSSEAWKKCLWRRGNRLRARKANASRVPYETPTRFPTVVYHKPRMRTKSPSLSWREPTLKACDMLLRYSVARQLSPGWYNPFELAPIIAFEKSQPRQRHNIPRVYPSNFVLSQCNRPSLHIVRSCLFFFKPHRSITRQ